MTRLSLAQIQTKFAEGQHSIFSPSSAKRNMLCPGSLLPNLFAKEQESIYSAEGTVAHALSEDWLRDRMKPINRVGDVVREGGFDVPITTEMLDYIGVYVERCLVLFEGIGEHYAQIFVETLVPIGKYTPIPRQFGKCDCAILTPNTLYVNDLKFGIGVRVDAPFNPQTALYALGFIDLYSLDVEYVIIAIHQPRLDHYSEWSVSIVELREFGAEIKASLMFAWSLDAPRHASSEACFFCKVKGDCEEHIRMVDGMVQELADDSLDDYGEGEVEVLPAETGLAQLPKLISPWRVETERLVAIYRNKRAVAGLFRAIENELESRYNGGETIPGMTLKQGRAQRKWLMTEKETAEELNFIGLDTSQIVTHNLKSPAQIVEVLRTAFGMRKKHAEAFIKRLVQSAFTKPTLAFEGDTRDDAAPATDVLEDWTTDSDEL